MRTRWSTRWMVLQGQEVQLWARAGRNVCCQLPLGNGKGYGMSAGAHVGEEVTSKTILKSLYMSR